MQCFVGTDTVQNLYAQFALPPAENFSRKWFRCGDRKANTIQAVRFSLGFLKHLGIQRWSREEKRRPGDLRNS